ncbi:protein of unknown function [Tenacibaculum sp. MAR_2009_124]|uniref:DUF4625 domain-containing protein n=1 Tax=Tenacibaculum sp. MAR_2009_124 TaxID=1250059 RepID=UPI00089974D1|nr:DUF4625 domain-containing protein [Tenacibaculum sp. MAR_2009_124]SEC80967.1 protein of unknown function [Tenacibaculum sp. MAR_2009_124]
MKKLGLLFLLTLLAIACNSDNDEPDTTKPTITVQYDAGFPKSCDILEKGKQYTVKVKVSDNIALATYAIDIHHNFDHHTHDDQGAQCELAPIKTPVTPLIYMQNFSIENTPKEYEINQEINIPNDIDSGDYHCQISVIDVTGWQSRTSIDIKIQ